MVSRGDASTYSLAGFEEDEIERKEQVQQLPKVCN
jgi:hypothetical protein